MELHGKLSTNLINAVQSARRLRGHPVHGDTLAYWKELLDRARHDLAKGSTEPIQELIVELESELTDRTS
jgi:hypothetical protein